MSELEGSCRCREKAPVFWLIAPLSILLRWSEFEIRNEDVDVL